MSTGVTDNSAAFLRALDVQVSNAMKRCGAAMESDVAKLTPVDTGNLRSSITHDSDSDSAIVGTNIDYGKYVELGTRNAKAQPFIVPAVTNHIDDYHSMIKAELNK